MSLEEVRATLKIASATQVPLKPGELRVTLHMAGVGGRRASGKGKDAGSGVRDHPSPTGGEAGVSPDVCTPDTETVRGPAGRASAGLRGRLTPSACGATRAQMLAAHGNRGHGP